MTITEPIRIKVKYWGMYRDAIVTGMTKSGKLAVRFPYPIQTMPSSSEVTMRTVRKTDIPAVCEAFNLEAYGTENGTRYRRIKP